MNKRALCVRGLTGIERILLTAAKVAESYIANTECELGITLASGELLRAAIAKASSCTFECCRGLAPDAECGCACGGAMEGGMTEWQSIDTAPQDGLFIVHEDGAVRMMLREGGRWLSTATALDEYGNPSPSVRVRETGVYNPTHWMPPPEPPEQS